MSSKEYVGEAKPDHQPMLAHHNIPNLSRTNGNESPKGVTANSDSSKPPEHLSEFYSFMNNKSNIPLSPTPSSSSRKFPPPEDRKIQRQPSMNTFTSFSPSVLDLPNIVTSKDFQNNIKTYNKLLTQAANLRASLLQVSEAANDFGQALEECITECPKTSNSKSVSEGLINAAGLQYMIGSNQQILSRLICSSFEEPLARELTKLQKDYDVNHGYYQQEVKIKSQLLREKELENLKLSKQKTRNLNTYKNNLLNLTNQLEEIDRLKYDYYHEINSMIERFNLEYLLIKTGSLVRAQLEIFEGIARKGWSGGGLDDLLEVSPDLFEAGFDSDDNSAHIDNHDDRLRNLDKSVSVSTFKQNISGAQDTSDAISNIDKDIEEIIKINDEDEYNEDETTVETVIKSTPLQTTIDQNTKDKDINREKEREKGKDFFRPIITPSLSYKKITETDGIHDESFSLPVVNNSSLLGLRLKSSDGESSPDVVGGIDHRNILDELDD